MLVLQVRKYKAIQALKSVGTIQQAMNMVGGSQVAARGHHAVSGCDQPQALKA
jgi:hypothetical protein